MTARAFIAGALFGALCLYLWLVSTPHPTPAPGRQRFKQRAGQGGNVSKLFEAVDEVAS